VVGLSADASLEILVLIRSGRAGLGLVSSGTRLSHIPISFFSLSCYASLVLIFQTPKGALFMEWTTPQHEEIDLNCEVSSYANAEL